MDVTIPNLLLVPLVWTLASIFLGWLYYGIRSTARSLSAGSRIYRCRVCEHVYLEERDVPLARCPRCGCLNEAIRR
jgi:hypothetical protein